jgi:hypothetical protein
MALALSGRIVGNPWRSLEIVGESWRGLEDVRSSGIGWKLWDRLEIVG